MELACLDLEGVLIPEIWIGFAEKTGIDSLRATTRDIPDGALLRSTWVNRDRLCQGLRKL